jgi:hypothetical protein
MAVTLWQRLRQFLWEIMMFGAEAFVVVAAREIARRFWQRLASRGAAALLDPAQNESMGHMQKDNKTIQISSSQTRLPFLEEYRD